VRITTAKGSSDINGKPIASYFPLARQRTVALAPLAAVSIAPDELMITARAVGGGLTAQAEAFSLGLARTLVRQDASRRGRLKSLGFLTRDARKVERKKFGSRKARRPQQWRKR
jgi:small subunit ribosomal protein S9